MNMSQKASTPPGRPPPPTVQCERTLRRGRAGASRQVGRQKFEHSSFGLLNLNCQRRFHHSSRQTKNYHLASSRARTKAPVQAARSGTRSVRYWGKKTISAPWRRVRRTRGLPEVTHGSRRATPVRPRPLRQETRAARSRSGPGHRKALAKSGMPRQSQELAEGRVTPYRKPCGGLSWLRTQGRGQPRGKGGDNKAAPQKALHVSPHTSVKAQFEVTPRNRTSQDCHKTYN